MEDLYYKLKQDKYKSTLKETSRDDSKTGRNDIKYMTESEEEVINYDAVKNHYIEGMGLSVAPKSVDALFIVDGESSYIIEFKNGVIDNAECYSIQKKVYDSLLILLDRIGKNISFSREHIHFILVYNEDVEHMSKFFDEDKFEKRKKKFNYYRDKIVKRSKLLADDNYTQFGLRYFKKMYFKTVNTFTKKEFDFWISNNLYK